MRGFGDFVARADVGFGTEEEPVSSMLRLRFLVAVVVEGMLGEESVRSIVSVGRGCARGGGSCVS